MVFPESSLGFFVIYRDPTVFTPTSPLISGAEQRQVWLGLGWENFVWNSYFLLLPKMRALVPPPTWYQRFDWRGSLPIKSHLLLRQLSSEISVKLQTMFPCLLPALPSHTPSPATKRLVKNCPGFFGRDLSVGQLNMVLATVECCLISSWAGENRKMEV